MYHKPIVFIAFEARENLGIRYLASVLTEAGYKVKIIEFRKKKEEILEETLALNPLLVGFSVIYEKSILDFAALISCLRSNNIQSHFTAGGHFASLRPGDLFRIMPGMDSIVRFEGERSLPDLVNHIRLGRPWKELNGISYMENNELVNNPLCPLEPDLDQFPYPLRSGLREYLLGKKSATLLAGRGCNYNCTFCDTREFYTQASGPLKRVRKPSKVVDEMFHLYMVEECKIFLFEDEDFPVSKRHNEGWIEEFCASLQQKNLSGKIMWKINCRSDEVDPDTFELMKHHGLFRVFLGIEDGTNEGLKRMNKHLSLSDNIRAIQILKNLGIGIDYGFMLFQPSTTFGSLRKNLDFLEQICGDGYMPVSFLKMMPFLETKIKKELERAGRLKGKPGFLDYDFPDKAMNDYFQYVSELFETWQNAPDGFLNVSKWAHMYLSVFSFYYGQITGIQRLSDLLRKTLVEANLFFIDTLRTTSCRFESGDYLSPPDQELLHNTESIREKHGTLLQSVKGIIGKVQIYDLTKEIFHK